jgi:predicted DsbA family dithiol-disulfide isomerase
MYRLEIISDVICPWCYIGKKRLEKAMQIMGDTYPIETIWRPFELNPTLPPEGMNRADYLTQKFGSAEQAGSIYSRIESEAHADGLLIDFGSITTTPNTRLAHKLVDYSHEYGKQNDVINLLFSSYFLSGKNIGEKNVLLEIALACGLPVEGADTALNSDLVNLTVERQENAALQMGVSGVPGFVYNGHLLFCGAQTPETIALSLQRAIKKLSKTKA